MRKLKVPLSEVKYLGNEPVWSDIQPDSSMIIHAYNWYRAALEPKVARLILQDYMRHIGFPESAIDYIDYVEDWRFEASNLPALARMVHRGLKPNNRQQERLDLEIPLLVEHGHLRLTASQEAARRLKVKTTAPVAPKDSAGDAMAMIESALDSGVSVDANGILQLHRPKPSDLKNDTDRMARLVEEVTHALDRTDEQCVEAYQSYSKKQLRDLLARYAGVLQAINLYCSANIKQPTARKVRPKSPEKLVAKLRYLDKFDELGLVSINPKDIIGATEIVLYHTERRYVFRYVAPLGSKLSVRRSMIEGYDPAQSFRKKIKPTSDVLKRLTSGGIKSVAKTFEAIKTKSMSVNGTVNSQMIILRAGK